VEKPLSSFQPRENRVLPLPKRPRVPQKRCVSSSNLKKVVPKKSRVVPPPIGPLAITLKHKIFGEDPPWGPLNKIPI